MTSEQFIQKMVAAFPEVKSIHDQHQADNDELLPHVLMGDVTRYVISQTENKSTPVITKLLDFFEQTLDDEEIEELISVSFVENLFGEDNTIKALRPIMGPKLANLFKKVSK